jgi:hypothetical protein
VQALADTDNIARGETEGGGSGDVLQELLPDSRAPVFDLLELADPLLDRVIELGKRLLLLEERLGAEGGSAR